MDTLNLRILNSHYLLVTEDEKKFLIDTGSPISFCGGCDNMYIALGGTEYTIRPNSGMVDNLNNGELFQDRADGLIGMDILEGHSFEFDKVNNAIIVDAELDENAYSHSATIDITNFMGQHSVTIDVEVNRHPVKTIIDTGAWISYLSSQYLNGVESIGMVHDYNPMLGNFEATKHKVTLSVGGYSQNIIVGKMTNMIEKMMGMIEIGFVLGLDAINCDKICLDLRGKRILF